MVPSGMLAPAMLMLTAVLVLIVTSGLVKLPMGIAGTATLLILTRRTVGFVVGSGVLKGTPKVAVGEMVPVNVLVVASMRMRPITLALVAAVI